MQKDDLGIFQRGLSLFFLLNHIDYFENTLINLRVQIGLVQNYYFFDQQNNYPDEDLHE